MRSNTESGSYGTYYDCSSVAFEVFVSLRAREHTVSDDGGHGERGVPSRCLSDKNRSGWLTNSRGSAWTGHIFMMDSLMMCYRPVDTCTCNMQKGGTKGINIAASTCTEIGAVFEPLQRI
jgi:hypothetical protein